MMICPRCNTGTEMAYSVLSHGLICLEPSCGFELEIEPFEAREILEPEEQLVCC
jgi:hypothetical protein